MHKLIILLLATNICFGMDSGLWDETIDSLALALAESKLTTVHELAMLQALKQAEVWDETRDPIDWALTESKPITAHEPAMLQALKQYVMGTIFCPKPECSRKFKTSSAAYKHLGIRHKSTQTQEAFDFEFQQIYGCHTFNCLYCTKFYVKHGSLTEHLISTHAEQLEEHSEPASIDYPINITEPTKIPRWELPIPNEKKMRIKELACTQCERKFATKAERKRHFERKHKTENHFACLYEDCNKGYTTGDSLSLHIRRKHKTKHCVCPFCGMSYALECDLSQHMNRTIHKTLLAKRKTVG